MKRKTSFFQSSILTKSNDIINTRSIHEEFKKLITGTNTLIHPLNIEDIRRIMLERMSMKYINDVLNTITNKKLLNTLQSYTIKVIGRVNSKYLPINNKSNYTDKDPLIDKWVSLNSYVMPVFGKHKWVDCFIYDFIYMLEINMIEKNKLGINRVWRIIPCKEKENEEDIPIRVSFIETKRGKFLKFVVQINNNEQIISKLKNFNIKIEDICTELNFYDESLDLHPLFKITNGVFEVYR